MKISIIDISELKKRKWPTPSSLLEPEISYNECRLKEYVDIPLPYKKYQDYEEDVFVKEGKVSLKILRGIPPEECGITSLAVDEKNGKIYGATSGNKAHLFVFDTIENQVKELGIIEGYAQITNSLILWKGQVFLGTRSMQGNKPGSIYCYEKGEIKKVVTPIQGEGIASLVKCDESNLIYGLSTPNGVLFSFDIDTKTVEVKGKIDEKNNFGDVLCVGPDGCIYGAKQWGGLYRYNPEKNKIVPLRISIPALCGRKMYNQVSCLFTDHAEKLIYGGASADGILFVFDPYKEDIISLGIPVPNAQIRCLVRGEHGLIYGIAGKKNGISRMFRYNRNLGELKEIGMLFAEEERYWHGYEFVCMVAGKQGDIYLGENDRISHLFIYRTGSENKK